jgi:hypothetical protein
MMGEKKQGEEIAVLQSKMEDVELDIKDMRDDIETIKDTITGAKGSWKAFLAVLGILATGAWMIFDKLLENLFKTN